MEGPVRFRDSDDHDAKQLMLAMREERPPDGALERAVLALGAAGVIASTASVAGAASAASSPTFFKSLTWLGIKWLSVGFGVGALVGTGAMLLPLPSQSTPKLSDKTELAAPNVQTAVRPDPPRASDTPASLDSDSNDSAKRATQRVPAAAKADDPPAVPALPSSAGFALPAAAPDSLAREIELLDQARRALSRGSPSDALSTLDRFTREFPRGRLSAEAFVVRLDALVRAGRRAEARALAERHLSANPSSPHAARIRTLTGIGTP
jgi:hypothetical protein